MHNTLVALIDGLHVHGPRNAFCIGQRNYSYTDLANAVNRIREYVRDHPNETMFAIMAHDHLLTYAGILALWAEGRAYVPLSPDTPQERNLDILNQSGAHFVLTSEETTELPDAEIVHIGKLPDAVDQRPAVHAPPGTLAYLLFTSGTTGRPKGVPITRSALEAFISAFEAMGLRIGPADRCLQMFDLTFDLSVMAFMIPLLKGACVYTIPRNEIKYMYIHGLLEDHGISVALMAPSTLNFLRPYFDEVQYPALRVNLFCGEALPVDILTEWANCIPNARILNVYGPTEHTIFCTAIEYDRSGQNKTCNGVLSIGKPMMGTKLAITNEHGDDLPTGHAGELCLAGPQATTGYWNDPTRNRTAFIELAGERFYRTGDRCLIDKDGDALYLGRTDHQVKIQGFRVELAEVEHHARQVLGKRNLVAVALSNRQGLTELAVVHEGGPMESQEFFAQMRSTLPPYMVPTRLLRLDELPLNINGKIDRPKVTAWAKSLPE